MRNGHYHNHKEDTSNKIINGNSTIRCVLVGDACVGKTSLVVAYTRNGFSDHYVPTAFDNYSVTVNVDNKPLKLELCDTAGRSEFDSIRPLSYADANIFLLCFSVVKPESLNAITQRWLPELRAVGSSAPVILVGTQSDLRLGRMFNDHANAQPTDSNTLFRIASQYQAEYIECSAVTQKNLKEVFDLAILYGLNRRSAPKITESRNSSSLLRNSLTKNKHAIVKSDTRGIKTVASRVSNGGLTATNNKQPSNCNMHISSAPRSYMNGKPLIVSSATSTTTSTTNANVKKGLINNSSSKFPAKNFAQNNTDYGIENKLSSTRHDSVVNNGNGNKNGYINGNRNKNQYTSSPYSNWFSSNENRNPLYRSNNNGCAFEKHTMPNKPTVQPSTTFKDGFRKLVSMTRRFL